MCRSSFALALLLSLALSAPVSAGEPTVRPDAIDQLAQDVEFDMRVMKGDDERAAGHLTAAATSYALALRIRRDPLLAGRLGVLLVKIGKLVNKSSVKGSDLVGRFKGATRAEAQKIPGVELLADGADARAAGKSRGLPVLVIDGTLHALAPRGKSGIGAEVEYVVKREQALKGSCKGKGAVEDGASTRDAAAEKELQDQAMAAAVESALRGAPAVILASVQ